ncbi:MAG: replicative DNA helicase [Streptobacillus sp.]
MNEMDLTENSLHSLEIEKSILGSILIDPNIIYSISDRINSSDFYFNFNQLIYESILKRRDKYSKINLDLNILIESLKEDNIFDIVGGIEYLNELVASSYTSANIEAYIEIFKEYSKKRKLLNVSKGISKSIYDNKKNSTDLLEEVQVAVSQIDEEASGDDIIKLSELVARDYERNDKNNHIADYPKTKFIRYDEITNGLRPATLLILAARPAMGKTAFSLNIALNVAKQNKRVLIFSLEMGEEELYNRLLAAESEVELKNIQRSHFDFNNKEMINRLLIARENLSTLEIYIDASATPTITAIKNKARLLQRKYKNIDLIIIDYLQLISGTTNKGNREQEISEISRGLKLLSKELNVPIIALSQLSRRVESREDKTPMLSDLRESGSIEQDADQVMFLSSKDYYNNQKNPDEDNNKLLTRIELILAKNRSGSIGKNLLFFDKPIQKFKNPTHEEEKMYFKGEED